MKIIHTSDWHLGVTLYGHDRLDDHREMLRLLTETVAREQPDALLVSGDIFDSSSPSAAAERLLDSALMELTDAGKRDMKIILTSGNHDSPSRHTTHSAVYSRLGIHTIGSAGITADTDIADIVDRFIIRVGEKGTVIAVPYINRRNMPEGLFDGLIDFASREISHSLPTVMMAHLPVSRSVTTGHSDVDERFVGGCENVEIDSLGHGYDYLALGHIHCPQQWSTGNAIARYCGTPLPISFDESYPHSVTIVELPAAGIIPTVTTVALKPRRRLVTIGGPDGMDEEELTSALTDAASDLPDGTFIRLNLRLPEGTIFPRRETIAHLSALCGDLGLEYCTTNLLRSRRDDAAALHTALTVSEMRDMTEEEIAAGLFRRKGLEWSDELAGLLAEAVAAVKADDNLKS